mmetsp:Transcript_3749/g.17242  ORF Transcript_3749/g.17242 Transcript_3749/m.17242 type:complete len:225 (+) Transcript_3749:1057-1731(+)
MEGCIAPLPTDRLARVLGTTRVSVGVRARVKRPLEELHPQDAEDEKGEQTRRAHRHDGGHGHKGGVDDQLERRHVLDDAQRAEHSEHAEHLQHATGATAGYQVQEQGDDGHRDDEAVEAVPVVLDVRVGAAVNGQRDQLQHHLDEEGDGERDVDSLHRRFCLGPRVGPVLVALRSEQTGADHDEHQNRSLEPTLVHDPQALRPRRVPSVGFVHLDATLDASLAE